MKFTLNDYVVINNDETNLIYRIRKIEDNSIELVGLTYRVIKNVDINDISKATENIINNALKLEKEYKLRIGNIKERNKLYQYKTGKILHIDGDNEYLNKCIDLYNYLDIYCYGVCIEEKELKSNIKRLIDNINPDVIVITGHDLYNQLDIKDIDNYTNTKYFIDAVKEVRKTNQSCFIVAGACQSNYDALIAGGADFASSPGRINIHTYDPCVVAIIASITSFRELVDVKRIYKYIKNGRKAISGVQSFGKMRLLN